jgi:TonB family protein
MLNYFIFQTFSLFVFWTFYQVFLKRDTFFERNRWYLLISLAVALFAPFFDIPLSRQSAMEIGELQTFVLPEITIENVKTESWSWREVGQGIYFLGISINLIIFVLRFRKLLLLIYPTLKQRDKKVQLGQFTNVKIISSSQTFSFFNYLFWDSSQQLTSAEGKQILEHELAHINGGHSYDLIFIELQKILFWFNPLIYLYEKELRNQHEFIADRKAKTISNTEDYISLMVSSLFKSLQFNFTHSFHNQQIKQRIKMMNTKKTSWIKGNAKTVLAIALVTMVAVAVACSNALTSIDKDQKFSEMKVNQNLNQKDLIASYSQELQAFGKKYPKLFEGEKVELTDVTQLNMEGIGKKDKERISFIFGEIQATIKKLNQESINMNVTKTPDANDIYSVVDNMASPIGGLEEMYKLIGKEIRYPKEARENGIQGKIFVQFVVNTDGRLSDIEIVKGFDKTNVQLDEMVVVGYQNKSEAEKKAITESIANSLNEEGKRTVALTKWNPAEHEGKKVKQRLVIPIIFALD